MRYGLLKKTAILLIVCTILVTVSYQYIDKPLAELMYQHADLVRYEKIRQWLAIVSQILHFFAPILVILLIIKKLISDNLSKLQLTFLAIAINLMVTDNIKDMVKLVFGRYHLIMDVTNMHEWLQNSRYGFHPFYSGAAYQSFPSGHAAAIFAAMSIIWIIYPRWRWLCIISCGAVISGLLIFNDHFLSDVIAGAFLGTITGMYTVYLFVLDKRAS
jgi:membrane-associated phospholipid phosphatase